MSRQGVSLNGSDTGVVIEAEADDPLLGATLGSYELVGRIGAGDLGVVYRAYHQLLRQERALKLLPAQFSEHAEYVERFTREASLAAGLRHPNIVQIHDVGIDERYYYTVMELLQGTSLAVLLCTGPRLPNARALRLLEELAGALDYAHDQGVAHHDVKPANIMVGPRDHLTLVDFGIAHALDAPNRAGVERADAYVAPEVLNGTGGGITADRYALGVLAYELLVGQPPFATEATAEAAAEPTAAPIAEATTEGTAEPAAEPTAEPVADVTTEEAVEATDEPVGEGAVEEAANATEEATVEAIDEATAEGAAEPTATRRDTPISRVPRPPREFRPELPKSVEQVLLRQLSEDPDARYATSSELVLALRTALETRPARPDAASWSASGPRPADPWVSLQMELQEQHRSRQDQQDRPTRLPRRRFLATIGTLVVGAGLAAGGLAAWQKLVSVAAPAAGPAAEPKPTGVATSAPTPPVLAAAPVPPVARASLPIPIGLGPGSTITQGLRMDTLSYYRNAGGNVVLQGLLSNPAAVPAAIDSFQLAFLNETGSVVHTLKVTTAPLFVQPQSRAPWMQMAGRDLPAFAAVRVVVKASQGTGAAPSRSQRFEVTDQVVAARPGADDSWSINGRVTYRGEVPTTSVSILAAAFDGDGKLLRVGSAFASISRLAPGESSLFKVTVDAPTEVVRYELLVQGV